MLKHYFFNAVTISLIACTLIACVSPRAQINPDLTKGQYYFDKGYYKSAIRQLMPPAIAGCAEAQYAVGYMYYYGYGVAQDTDMGFFWIKKAADSGFPPAIAAIDIIVKDRLKEERAEKRIRKKDQKLEEKGVGPTI